jgi:CO/xanthine dehydrogenase Mo-binding subunit
LDGAPGRTSASVLGRAFRTSPLRPFFGCPDVQNFVQGKGIVADANPSGVVDRVGDAGAGAAYPQLAGLRRGSDLHAGRQNPAGVILVLTYKNAPNQGPKADNSAPQLIADKILHHGQPIALVVLKCQDPRAMVVRHHGERAAKLYCALALRFNKL